MVAGSSSGAVPPIPQPQPPYPPHHAAAAAGGDAAHAQQPPLAPLLSEQPASQARSRYSTLLQQHQQALLRQYYAAHAHAQHPSNSNSRAGSRPGSPRQLSRKGSNRSSHGGGGDDGGAGGAHSSKPPPRTTPILWLVLWTVACSGFLLGYTSGPNIAAAPAFRDTFLHQSGGARAQLEDRLPLELRAKHESLEYFCAVQTRNIARYMAPKYIAGCVSALPVGWVIRVAGRKTAIMIGCAIFTVAHVLRGSSSLVPLLMLGQALDGIATSFLYQAPLLEAIEVAPHNWRGACGYAEQVGRSIGLFSRSLLQQGLAMQPGSPSWGWRVAVLFPVWPALVALFLVPLLPETPNSLMQRGQVAAARAALQEIRGPLVSVEEEFKGILAAAGIKDGQKQTPLSQFRTLLQVPHLPPLIILLAMTLLREFLGGDFVLQYSRVLHMGLGLEDSWGFTLRQISNSAYCIGAVVGLLVFDTWGRRAAFLISSGGGFIFHGILTGALMAVDFLPTFQLTRPVIGLVHISLILAYGCYAVAWAVGYFVFMTELFPLATRSLGVSLACCLTLAFYGASTGLSLVLACRTRVSLFGMWTAVNGIAVVFVYACLPETKRVPLEDVAQTFRQPPHWLWRRFFPPSGGKQSAAKQQRHHRDAQGGSRGGSASRGSAPPPAGGSRPGSARAPAAAAAAATAAAADDGVRELAGGVSTLAAGQAGFAGRFSSLFGGVSRSSGPSTNSSAASASWLRQFSTWMRPSDGSMLR